jgi:hypothetical protein
MKSTVFKEANPFSKKGCENSVSEDVCDSSSVRGLHLAVALQAHADHAGNKWASPIVSTMICQLEVTYLYFGGSPTPARNQKGGDICRGTD